MLAFKLIKAVADACVPVIGDGYQRCASQIPILPELMPTLADLFLIIGIQPVERT